MKSVVSFSLLVLSTLITYGQSKEGKVAFSKEFNWSITIPENFEYVSSEECKKVQDKGEAAIEDTFNEDVVNRTKTIFVIKAGDLNFFESSYQPFDESVDGKYLDAMDAVYNALYETFTVQMPGVKIDTAKSIESVDNLKFNTWKADVTYPNNMIFHIIMYSRLFDKREFTASIMYVDESKGAQMKDAWMDSTFSSGKK